MNINENVKLKIKLKKRNGLFILPSSFSTSSCFAEITATKRVNPTTHRTWSFMADLRTKQSLSKFNLQIFRKVQLHGTFAFQTLKVLNNSV